MNIETGEQLAALCDILRAKGVRAFEVNGIKVEFGPPADAAQISSTAAETDPELCRCGHGGHQHMNSLCIMGCEPEKCLEPEKAS